MRSKTSEIDRSIEDAIETKFMDVCTAYECKDPNQIQLSIIWRYVRTMFVMMSQSEIAPGGPFATVNDLRHHMNQFDICDQILEKRRREKNSRKIKAWSNRGEGSVQKS